MDILSKDDSTTMPNTFKAEIVKKRKDHRDLMKVKCHILMIDISSRSCYFKLDNSLCSPRIKARTGWPQTVWQSELNRHENFHQP